MSMTRASGMVAVRVAATLALIYLSFLTLVIGQGSQDWHGASQVAGLEPEWYAWAVLLLGILSLTSIRFIWLGFQPQRSTTPTPIGRALLTVATGVLMVTMVMAIPTARAAAREYNQDIIAGLPGRWLGWAAIPLILNAVAVVILDLWPRIRGKAGQPALTGARRR